MSNTTTFTTYEITNDLISEIDGSESTAEQSNDEEVSDTQTENKQSNIQISKEFQENVIKYVKLDDLIKKKQQELAELREQSKPCKEYILKYLENIGEDEIGITNGKLKRNKSETKTALNQEVIKTALLKKIEDPAVVEDIMKEMENSRQSSTKVNLSRTAGKAQRKRVTKQSKKK